MAPPDPRDRVVVGLGNPGPRYEGSRHNLGFEVVDEVARRLGSAFSAGPDCFVSHRAGVHAGQWLIRPTTFMNLSGRVLPQLDPEGCWPSASILVVYDDLDLPPGRLRVRKKGSDGGHRGVRSMIEVLGTPDFPRLRVGVGASPEDVDTVEWVLTRPEPGDRELLDLAVAEAARGVISWLDCAPPGDPGIVASEPREGSAPDRVDLELPTEALMRELNGWRPPATEPPRPRPDDGVADGPRTAEDPDEDPKRRG